MQYVNINGVRIPALGFGTFQLQPDDAYRMVRHALAAGYRHIDTAQMYGNEEAVGAALRDAGLARDKFFLTTKILPDNVADGDLQASATESLRRLGVDEVDLLLQHWPSPDIALAESLGALNDVHGRGLARHIGVSNFTTTLVDQAVALSETPLVVNQVEYHPFLDQQPVKRRLDSHGMALTAYCPLAQGAVFNDDTLAAIARTHGCNAGQVALRWLLQQGVIAIPRSRSEAHADANLAVFDFELGAEEMQQIHALAHANGRIVSPSNLAPVWDTAA